MGISEDLAQVVTLIDPYLEETLQLKTVDDPATGRMVEREYKVIVDDGRPDAIQPLMRSSEGRTAALMTQVQGDSNSEHYWYEYGRLVHEKFQSNQPMGIRCDACTALAYFLLKGNVSGSITVIEQ